MSTLFQTAREELYTLGLTLEKTPGQYRVNFRGGSGATEYLTDELDEALRRGREMAAQPPPFVPPLGPLGPRSTRRGFMYRHNRKIATRRSREHAKQKQRPEPDRLGQPADDDNR